jgi:hypothetical protein
MAQIITLEELDRQLAARERVFDAIDAQQIPGLSVRRISRSRRMKKRVKVRAIRRPMKR